MFFVENPTVTKM